MLGKKFSLQGSCCSLIMVHETRVTLTCVGGGGGGGTGVSFVHGGGKMLGQNE